MDRGQDTPECQTIVATTENLRLALQHDLVSIGSALVGRGVISTEQYARLRNRMHSEADRAADLIQWIQEKIQGSEIQIYHTFVEVLQRYPLQYSHIVSILQQTYAQFQRDQRPPDCDVIPAAQPLIAQELGVWPLAVAEAMERVQADDEETMDDDDEIQDIL